MLCSFVLVLVLCFFGGEGGGGVLLGSVLSSGILWLDCLNLVCFGLSYSVLPCVLHLKSQKSTPSRVFSTERCPTVLMTRVASCLGGLNPEDSLDTVPKATQFSPADDYSLRT